MAFFLFILIVILLYLVYLLVRKIFEEKHVKEARELLPGKVSVCCIAAILWKRRQHMLQMQVSVYLYLSLSVCVYACCGCHDPPPFTSSFAQINSNANISRGKEKSLKC